MDWITVLAGCTDAKLGQSVTESLNMLFERDKTLLANDTAERAISPKLAQYLQIYFPNYDVDVEYNRMGDAPKRLLVEGRFESVYPDIIVHRRMKRVNILAIELKKDSNPEKKWKDLRKLTAYKHELGYKHALFLRLGTGVYAGTVSECEWVSEPIFSFVNRAQTYDTHSG